MKNKRTIKDKKIKTFLKNGGRDGARKDFYELLRRAARSKKISKAKSKPNN